MPITVFAGGQSGQWRVEGIAEVMGPSLPAVSRLDIRDGASTADPGAAWALRRVTSNARYTRRREQQALAARQAGSGRPEATRAALIPITKSQAWWALAQDERRELLEETSRHITIGLEYLPGIARRLHHGRELGEVYDFLTWFEYAPQHASAFEDLVFRLRATPEWEYVEREVDVRLARNSPCRVPGIPVTDLADVLVLRDATHAALSRLADDEPVGAAALDVVNAALARTPMSVTTAVRANGIALEYAACSGGAGGLVATLALHVGQLLASADRASIRKCARLACPLLFVQYHRRRRFCHHRCSKAKRQRLHRQRQQQRSTP